MDANKLVEWREVQGTNGMYEVSNTGAVRSWCNSWHPKRKTPRLLRPSISPKGYLRVAIYGKTRLIHHLVLESFIGSRPQGMETRHLNGIPKDNRAENLIYGTAKENQVDRLTHGTSNRGKRGKLTEQDVLHIRASNEPQKKVAAMFGISRATVHDIRNRRKWKWLEAT